MGAGESCDSFGKSEKNFPNWAKESPHTPPPSPILEVLASSPQLTNVANGLEGYFAGILKIFSNTPCLSIPHIYTCIGSSCIIYRCIFKRILYFWDLTLFSLWFNSYQHFYMITWQTLCCVIFFICMYSTVPLQSRFRTLSVVAMWWTWACVASCSVCESGGSESCCSVNTKKNLKYPHYKYYR